MTDQGLEQEAAERRSGPPRRPVEGVSRGIGRAGGAERPSEGLLVFEVLGEAKPQGSKRHVGNGLMVESCKALKPWREAVTAAAIAAGAARWDGPVVVRLAFRFDRPKGHWGAKGLRPSAPAEKTTKPDLDKLVRAVLDGLWPAWGDDAQVVELTASKRFCDAGELPGVWVEIERA